MENYLPFQTKVPVLHFQLIGVSLRPDFSNFWKLISGFFKTFFSILFLKKLSKIRKAYNNTVNTGYNSGNYRRSFYDVWTCIWTWICKRAWYCRRTEIKLFTSTCITYCDIDFLVIRKYCLFITVNKRLKAC